MKKLFILLIGLLFLLPLVDAVSIDSLYWRINNEPNQEAIIDFGQDSPQFEVYTADPNQDYNVHIFLENENHEQVTILRDRYERSNEQTRIIGRITQEQYVNSGDYTLYVNAYYDENNGVTDTLSLTVNEDGENTRPVVTDITGYHRTNSGSIPFEAYAEDDETVTSVEFEVYYYDGHGDPVSYFHTDSYGVNGWTYGFGFDSSDIEYEREVYVRARAYDNEGLRGLYYEEGPFIIDNREDVEPVNHAPTISLESPNNGAENQRLLLNLEWESIDEDGDNLYHNVYLNNQPVRNCQNIEDTSCTLYTLNYGTEYSWYVTVNDGEEITRSETWSFTTIEENDFNTAPHVDIISPRENQIISGNYRIQWEAYDNEQEDPESLHVKLEYTKRVFWLFNSGWNTLYEGDNDMPYYYFNTELLNNGYYRIRVTVTDNGGLTDSDNIDFRIVNDGEVEDRYHPEIISEPEEYATLNEVYEYQVKVKDRDSTSFTYSLLEAPTGMRINDNGLVTWIPKKIGIYTVSLQISDGIHKSTQTYNLMTVKKKVERDWEPEFHKFTLSNAILTYDNDYVYIYPMLRNLGNYDEDIEIKVYNVNNGDFKTDSFNLGVSQGKYIYIIMNKPLPGYYTYRIEAKSDDYSDIIFRNLEVL